MLTLLSYTFHVATLVTLILVLLSIKVSHGYMEQKYRRVLVILSSLFLINIPCDLFKIYYIMKGTPSQYLDFFFVRLIDIFSILVAILAFHYLLGTPRRKLQVAQYQMSALVVLCFFHVVLYSNHRLENNLPINLHSYSEYCVSSEAITLQYIIYTVLIMLILMSLFHFYYIQRLYSFVAKKHSKELGKNLYLVNKAFLGMFCFVVFYLIDFFADKEYYGVVIFLWSFVSLAWAIYVINNRENIKEINRISALIYLKLEASGIDDSFKHIIFGKETKIEDSESIADKTLKERERIIVARAIADWENDPSRMFDQPNITIKDLAQKLNIPIGVIIHHGTNINGMDFDEYINNLRELK